MSGRRSSRCKYNEDEINDLILKLQSLLPHDNPRRNERVPASKILKEICEYIQKLHKEMDGLSETISKQLNNIDISSVDIDVIRNLLQ